MWSIQFFLLLQIFSSLVPFCQAWGLAGMSEGETAGMIVLIVIIVLLLVGILGIYCHFRRKQAIYQPLLQSVSTRSSPTNFEMNGDELVMGEMIGVGSFGQVYRGQWRGTEVAIKKLPMQNFTQQMIDDFMREIHLLSLLRHPNIVQFLGAIAVPPTPILVTEFMERGSLHAILHNHHKKVSWKKLKHVAIDAAKGLNYLHTNIPQIIHRDFKSHNLLVDGNWRAKICDFGLSRIIDNATTGRDKKMTLCGTPSWAAPEVLRNEPYTEKVDIYSFGMVMWEMVSRQDPFPNVPPFQVILMVGTQRHRPTIPDNCPPEWRTLLTICWEDNADLRPSFGNLIPMLEQLRL